MYIKQIKTIQNKGLLETFVYGLQILFLKISSICKIFFLRFRGYNIDYSVLIRGNVFFFQSTKKAIIIAHNSILGKHTRISGGGKGKVTIGSNVLVDDFTYIMAHEKIEIGKDTKIAAFCFITDFNHKYEDRRKPLVSQGYETKPVYIGNNVWIGTHVVVLPGVTIGNGSVIGAGSVVTKNIPSHSIAVGNPARVIKSVKKH
jgi:acetyltransferase-like isoleucine patch superfamily enzyme